MDFLTGGYLWLKAIHLIAVISWLAGLLYLPRLFIYHCDAENGSVQSETFKVMEQRLYKAIMTPAMVATWIFGGLLLSIPGIVDWQAEYWIYPKLCLVLLLSGFHGFLGKQVKQFAADRNLRPARFFRVINEIPALIMVFIVILVIVKPF